MKRMAMMGLVAFLLSSSSGCCLLDRVFSCDRGCRGGYAGHHGGYGRHGGNGGSADCDECQQGGGMGGGASVAYPYYTTRGPRDYLACNPGHPRN